MRLRIALISLASALLLLPAAPAFAATYNPLQPSCNVNGASGSSLCNGNNNGHDTISGTNGALYKVARVFGILTGIASIIVIIISAIRYITAGGDANKAAEARRAIIGAVIGLVIVAMAGTIITYIINQAG